MAALEFALGALVLLVYIGPYTGAAIPTGWAFLWIFTPILLIADWYNGRKIAIGAPHWLGLFFIGWSIVTLTWAPDYYGAGFEVFELGPFVMLFLWASSRDDLTWVYRGFAVGLGINALIAIAQMFGFDAVAQMSRPAGLFVSKNLLGEVSALVAIVLVASRMWAWLPVTLPGLLLTYSRGAWLALYCAAFVALWHWRRWLAIASLMIPLTAAALTYSLDLRTPTLTERYVFARDTLAAVTLTGHGFGSFGHEFPTIAKASDVSRRRPDHAHNDFLEIAFEVGLIGIVPLGFLVALLLCVPLWTERLALVGFLAISLCELPLHAPTEICLGAVVAGRLARGWALHRRTRGLRGPAQYGWLFNRRSLQA